MTPTQALAAITAMHRALFEIESMPDLHEVAGSLEWLRICMVPVLEKAVAARRYQRALPEIDARLAQAIPGWKAAAE